MPEELPAIESKDCIGFIKYEGKLVEEGILDARSAAKALHGFDHALRYFVTQEQPDLATVEFPIPVQIKRGSWWATIPQSAEPWVLAALGIAGTAYLTKAASKMAERDFAEVGFKDVFKKALKSVQWMIKIGKHVGTLTHKKLTGLRWLDNNETVGIPNGSGEYLNVPRIEFEQFLECPSSILSEVASIIEVERRLTVGLNEDGKIEEVTISRSERAIFFADDDESNDILFPELVHGKHVELDGVVTRGNERTNSIGFLYEEHVITCYPKHGSIVRFKPHLFLECRIIGVITRQNTETGECDEPRPKIIFDELILMEKEEDQGKLL
jgi:hypothetical protein